jgi:hypothetical protein
VKLTQAVRTYLPEQAACRPVLREAALIVCRDQSDSFITPPNLNAVTTYIAASLDQGGIIALAFDDPWRSVQAIISIDLVKAISDHVRRPL